MIKFGNKLLHHMLCHTTVMPNFLGVIFSLILTMLTRALTSFTKFSTMAASSVIDTAAFASLREAVSAEDAVRENLMYVIRSGSPGLRLLWLGVLNASIRLPKYGLVQPHRASPALACLPLPLPPPPPTASDLAMVLKLVSRPSMLLIVVTLNVQRSFYLTCVMDSTPLSGGSDARGVLTRHSHAPGSHPHHRQVL